MAESRTSRSARSAERRRRISQVATQQISEHGFENLSVNDVATAAGLSVGGIYRYITTKTDLLLMACEDIYDQVRDELGEIAASSEPVPEKFRLATVHYLTTCYARRAQIAMVYREYRKLPEAEQEIYKEREQAIINIFADLIRAGTRSGQFQECDARVTAIDIVFLGHMPAFKGWAMRATASVDSYVESQADFVMSALTLPL